MYFASVALLVLLAGFLYYTQMRSHLLKSEEFSMLEYARHRKMGGPPDEFGKDYSYRFIPVKNRHIDIRNFKLSDDRFIKLIPLRFGGEYLEVIKLAKEYKKRLNELIVKIIIVQILLLFLFGLLSYQLAKNAIRPLEESIELLDSFIKDLIHDLNTPLTAIKLNLTVLLEMAPELKNTKVMERLLKSAKTVSELHENLTILLEEKTFQSRSTDLCPLIKEVVELQKSLYPNITFDIECEKFYATLHSGAFKQILQNLLSNACRYNRPSGSVYIYTKGKTLYIEDTGIGIKEPEKIFDRDYSGMGSSGLGLDIVKRLAQSMQIDIKVKSNEDGGSIFILKMR